VSAKEKLDVAVVGSRLTGLTGRGTDGSRPVVESSLKESLSWAEAVLDELVEP
jgi:hypothetical protein